MAVAATATRAATMHRLTVSRVERLTDDAVAVTLDVPGDLRAAYRFVQGQHVALALPDAQEAGRRSYSICSPATSDELRVAVKRIPGGRFSEHVHTALRAGDELDVLTPAGRFHTPLDPTQAKRYAAVAAGSGITPILSLLTTTLEVEQASTFTLLYGNRTTASTMFVEELLDLKNRYPERFALYNVLSRERQSVPLLDGRIDGDRLNLFLATVLSGGDFDEWFLCGPLELVEALRGTLVAQGVDERRIHRELFHVGPAARAARPAARADAAAVTIVLDGRATTFEVVPGAASILDEALAARPEAPYACKGGVCGTCRAHVAAGEVEMLGGYALEPAELEAGFVLACQSLPRTSAVTLDFDA